MINDATRLVGLWIWAIAATLLAIAAVTFLSWMKEKHRDEQADR